MPKMRKTIAATLLTGLFLSSQAQTPDTPMSAPGLGEGAPKLSELSDAANLGEGALKLSELSDAANIDFDERG
jgi:hypothetical protein